MAKDPEFYLNNKLSWFAHITPEAVCASLQGFPLQSCYSDRWLAGSIRRVFVATVSDAFEDYPGTVHVRAELEAISDSLKSAIDKLERRSNWAESVLRTHAIVNAYDTQGDDEISFAVDELSEQEKIDPQYIREAALHEDDWWWAEKSLKLAKASTDWSSLREQINGIYSLQSYIDTAVDKFCSVDEPPRWRDMERRKRRIDFASWLSAVFEVAYQKRATVNNWTDDGGLPKLGHWPDFFNRIGCLALKLERIPDLQGILKEARRHYKEHKVATFTRDFPDETPP